MRCSIMGKNYFHRKCNSTLKTFLFGTFSSNYSNHIVSDPTALEEKVADSLLLLSVNSYREICGMHFEGAPLPSSDVVIKCSRNAVNTATHLVKQIKKALSDDLEKR